MNSDRSKHKKRGPQQADPRRQPSPRLLSVRISPGRPKLQNTIRAFTEAGSWRESKRIVESHPELLTDEADALLARMIKAQKDILIAYILEEHRQLLADCRSEGVDEAFANRLPEKPSVSGKARAELSRRISSARSKQELIAFLTEHPELKLVLKPKTSQPGTAGSKVRPSGPEIARRQIAGDVVQVPPRFQGQIARLQAFPNTAEGFERRVEVYTEILAALPRSEAPAFWGAVQHDLGNSYKERIRGNRAENLEKAIAAYSAALEVRTRADAPFDWAMTQNALGNAHFDRIQGERADNIEQAILHYQQALQVRTLQAFPEQWTTTQNNLAIAYSERIQGDRAKNQEKAISTFQAALKVRTRKRSPIDWAEIQHNLGSVYSERIQGDWAENLEKAISIFQAVLQVRTRKRFPVDWAVTQNNLGNAYEARIRGNRAGNLEKAIVAFQAALEVRTYADLPLDWATTQLNLGGCYLARIRGERAENLEEAISAFQAALKVFTRANFPRRWAAVQSNLGNAYAMRIQEKRRKNLKQAIECHKRALCVYTSEAAPHDYADAQNNLGLAYAALSACDGKGSVRQAIECFEKALRIYTPETDLHKYRRTNCNLAGLYFSRGDWGSALPAYRATIEAGELLYRAGLSAENRAAEVRESVQVYSNAAFAAARAGHTTEALLILERGKTRLLGEALRLRASCPAHVPSEVWSAFEQASAAVRSVQSQGAVVLGKRHDLAQAYAAQERVARDANVALDAAIERVRKHAPDFFKDLDISAVLNLLPDERSALVTFCITSQGSMGFVVNRDQGEAVQMVEMPGFTQADFRYLMGEIDADGQPVGGWLVDSITGDARWPSTIERVLADIGEKLLVPILTALPPDIETLIFLPAGGLALLPLHAVPLSDDGSSRVCDRYRVSYAPSAEVLADCQAKSERASENTLYAVINPQKDPRLIFTPVEGAAIAALFEPSQVLVEPNPTRETVLQGIQGRAYLHFACHGVYDLIDPPKSGLRLADGRLTLGELQSDKAGQVDISAARLVTLSACEIGVTDIIKGSADEYVGLPAGFMLAGVPCVLSTLWKVDEFPTALLMGRFYENLLRDDSGEAPAAGFSLPPAEALRRAQLWLRGLTAEEVKAYLAKVVRNGQVEEADAIPCRRYCDLFPSDGRPFESPYYWAAFTVYGA